MSNTWDGSTLDFLGDNSSIDTEGETCILVNGAKINVEPGESLPEKIISVARESGFGKFNVKMNGQAIEPDKAPSIFSEGDVVEIQKYDVAG